VRAVTTEHPRGRYIVGPDAWLQAAIAITPTRVFDRVTSTLVG
jgi:hypothetical protein